MSAARCQNGRIFSDTSTPCMERPEGDSFYCAAHKAEAMARVAMVTDGDKVRRWSGRTYWVAGQDSA